jgi:DNA-binding NarL/FixJ family response regulator
MSVVVAEDMLMFREMVVRSCVAFGHQVVGQTARGDQAVDLCRHLSPDVLLLDMRLPDIDGFGVVEAMRSVRLATKVIVLTAYASELFFSRLEKADIWGYVDKNSHTMNALEAALASVSGGRRWFSPTYREARSKRIRDPHAFSKLLTQTEQTVLSLIGEACSDAEIAARLGMAARTAQTHRSNIMQKLGIECTPKLVVYARTKGFTAGVEF